MRVLTVEVGLEGTRIRAHAYAWPEQWSWKLKCITTLVATYATLRVITCHKDYVAILTQEHQPWVPMRVFHGLSLFVYNITPPRMECPLGRLEVLRGETNMISQRIDGSLDVWRL